MTLWEATRAVEGKMGAGRRAEDEQQLGRKKGRVRGVWMVMREAVGRMREFNLTYLSIQTIQTTWSRQRMLKKKQQKIQRKT